MGIDRRNVDGHARRMARNFSWLSLQEVFIRLVGLATAIYLARVLGAENYGQLGLALGIISFAAVVVRSGTGSRGTRMTARDPVTVPELYAQITGLRLISAIALIGSIAVFAPWLGDLFQVSPWLLILCSFLLLRPALSVVWAFRGPSRLSSSFLVGFSSWIVMSTWPS